MPKKSKDLTALVAELYPHKDISLKPEAMVAYCEHLGITEPSLSDLEAADDSYYGEHRSDRDFAYELADATDLFGDLPKHGRHTHPCELYFDWDKYARDLMYDFFESSGHYFRNQ